MRFIGFVVAALLAATPAFADFDAVLTYARLGDTAKVVELLGAGNDPNPPEYHDGYSPLQFAAGNGDAEMTKALLAAGAGTEYRDHNEDRALLWAVQNGQAATVKLLIDAGSPADSNADPYGMTPAMTASRNGHVDILRLLLAAGADVNRYDQTGTTALHYAARLDDATAIKMLLAAGANPNVFDEIFLETPLHEAARWSDGATVAPLLAAGAAIEARTGDGKTPLYAAAEYGNAGVLAALLAAHADPDARAISGQTPILSAMSSLLDSGSGWARTAELLAPLTADLDNALVAALSTDHYAIALTLLERGASPNAVDADGRSALAAAAGYPRQTYFEHLLLRGADVERLGPEALLAAAANGRTATVVRLLDLGVPVDSRDPRGATAFLRAVSTGQVDTIALLLERGADRTATDMFGGGVAEYMTILPNLYTETIDRREASRALRPTDDLHEELDRLEANHARISILLESD